MWVGLASRLPLTGGTFTLITQQVMLVCFVVTYLHFTMFYQHSRLCIHLETNRTFRVATANLQVQLIDNKTNLPVTDAVVDLKTTQLENNWLAFAYQGVFNEVGKLIWQQQFFDGAPHKIEVQVAPKPYAARQFEPFQVQREIEVEGVAPPLLVRLIVLGYLTGIIGIGLAIGLKLRKYKPNT